MKNISNTKILFGLPSLDRKSSVLKSALNKIKIVKEVYTFMKGIKSLELPPKMPIQSLLNTNEYCEIFKELK